MGNCSGSGHWNNWSKDDKGKFERNDHKSKCDHKHDHNDSCCGEPKHKDKNDCILINKVICSQSVQKTGEFAFPFAIGPLGGTLGTGAAGLLATVLSAIFGVAVGAAAILAGTVSVRVRPVFTGIEQEITVVKDKIINLGFIPAFLELRLAGVLSGVSIPIRIFFQEHTDCPGVCPGDTVTETPPVVEAVLDQDLLQLENGSLLVNFLLFKAIVRTRITATRQVLVDPKDHDCVIDVNERRCDPTGTPININFPRPGSTT